MPQDQKHYYAFISHSSADAKIALWLRSQLENYHIPTAVQHTYNVPKRLRPVFCYQTDLAGNKLHDALKKSLDDSEFLIVVCTPASAQSIYVNNEIEYFIEIGKADKIIPVIVAGEPYASLNNNPQNECFAPALIGQKDQEKELRGINFNETKKQLGSKKAAVVNIIASMLGVRFDALWNRYKKRQRRIRTIVGFIIAFVLLEIIAAWNMYRPTYKYYADYTDRWGVPEGIIELTEEQRSVRNRMWMFEYRRVPYGEPNYYSWRISRIFYISSDGIPQEITDSEMKDRYPIQEFEYYKTNGHVSRINFYDSRGHVLLRHIMTEKNGVPATIADFVDPQEHRGGAFINANLTSMVIGQMDKDQVKSKIVRFVYKRDDNGYIVRKTYHSNNDYELRLSATSDQDGIYGIRYERDALGRPIKIEYLGKDYTITANKQGIAGRLYEYAPCGNTGKTTYIGIDGQPTLNEMGCAIITDTFDERGNIIEEAFLDKNGNLCMTVKDFALAKFKYNEMGLPIEEAYYDAEGKPCMIDEGMAIVRTIYNLDINEIETAFFDTLGHYCTSNEGIYRAIHSYDKWGNIIKICFKDSAGNFCLSNWGVAAQTIQYDQMGNITETTFQGLDGKNCLCHEGYAKLVVTYNDKGEVVEQAYYDTMDSLCLNNKGIAKEKYWYDERGNLTDCWYYGTDGELIMSTDGYAIRTKNYDEFGREIDEKYYDADVHQIFINAKNDQ